MILPSKPDPIAEVSRTIVADLVQGVLHLFTGSVSLMLERLSVSKKLRGVLSKQAKFQ